MRRKLLWGIGAAVLSLSVSVAAAWEGEPVVGVDLGAAFPTGDTKRTAGVGGSVIPTAGYRFSKGEEKGFAVSLLAEPQFVVFPTAVYKTANEVIEPASGQYSLFSFTVGPRLSLKDGPLEVFGALKGGYYTSISGPLKDGDIGWNISGGISCEVVRGTALGVFVRRDEFYVPAAFDSKDNFIWGTVGVSFVHRFLPAPAPAPVTAP